MVSKQYITIDPDTESLTLYGYGAEKTISLKAFNDGLKKKYDATNMSIELSELTTILQSDGITIKLILQGYGFPNPEFQSGNNNEYLNISGYALIKG